MTDLDRLIHTYAGQATYQLRKLAEAMGYDLPAPKNIEDSPFAKSIMLIGEAANGGDVFPDALEDAIAGVLRVLFAQAGATEEHIPAEFWREPLGKLITAARAAGVDDLITHSEAARMLYGTATAPDLRRFETLLKSGKVNRYFAPDERNPRKAGRVRRSEVEKIAQGN
ncbi:MAG TPA: hypothetical protein PLD47_13965 [Aggregatilineales bacterium]|nr:MAG: hypothetical protein HKUEN02_00960 [Anaerolineaceae bacterium]HRE48828.1 hypothetical protein [Aggregatilineales bacterium]